MGTKHKNPSNSSEVFSKKSKLKASLSSKIPKPVLETCDRLKKQGYDVYIVGGVLRDLLLGKTASDWDLASNASPEDVQKLFERTIDVGKSFGTLGVVTDEKKCPLIQITAFRSEEAYNDHRHPDQVKLQSTIEEDLARRDFTINALALDPQSMKLIDVYNGQEDLNNLQLRTVGDPRIRFEEDALRILRAARFISQLNLKPQEELTFQAMKKVKEGHIAFVSQERIETEFIKLMQGEFVDQGLLWMQNIDLLEKVIRTQSYKPLSSEQAKKLTLISSEAYKLRMTLLFHFLAIDIPKEYKTKLKDWRFLLEKSPKELFTDLDFYHEWLFVMGEKGLHLLKQALNLIELGTSTQLQKLVDIQKQGPIVLQNLNINGDELKKIFGLSSGPELGQHLQDLLKAARKGRVPNQKQALLDYLRKKLDSE